VNRARLPRATGLASFFGGARSARNRNAGRPMASLAVRMHNAIIDIMAQLIVRNLEETLVRALKLRAAQRGISVEALHREILREALGGKRKGKHFKQALAAMPPVGDDDDFVIARDQDRPDDLSD
jgi:plasmid stability protein